MADQLYVRIQGRVQGPFGQEKLRSLVKRGQLGRMHEVSPDSTTWQRASDFPEIFVSDAAEPTTGKPAGNGRKPAESDVRNLEGPASQTEAAWYYASGDQEHGPVDLKALQSKILTGEVNGDSQVWTQGMADWAPAESVPGLIPGPARGTPLGRLDEQRSPTDAPATLGKEVARIIGESRGWIIFIAVCAYVFAIALVAVGILMIIRGSRAEQGWMIASGLHQFLLAAVSIVGGGFLTAYQNRISVFVRNRSEVRLEAAMRTLRTFWLFLGIMLVVILVLSVLVGVWIFSELSIL